ncbi:MAG: hypothetical protein AABY65_06635 [Nitrospirota bacterium]
MAKIHALIEAAGQPRDPTLSARLRETNDRMAALLAMGAAWR